MQIRGLLISVLACSFVAAGAGLSGCRSSGKVFRNHWSSGSTARPAEMERAGSGPASSGIEDGVLSPSDHVLGPHAQISPANPAGSTSNHALIATALPNQAVAPEENPATNTSDELYNPPTPQILAAVPPIAAQTIAYPLNRTGPAEAVATPQTPSPSTDGNATHLQDGAPTAVAQAPTSPTLQLEIRGVRAGRGDIKLAVFDTAESFPTPTKAMQTLSLKTDAPEIQQGTMTVALPADRPIAVAVFQDIDGDGQLGRNRLGIPVEPFAFSNNAMGRRGPPDFAAALVQSPSNPQMPWRTTIQLP